MRLFLFICFAFIFSSQCVVAQYEPGYKIAKADTATKIDYMQPGAPMPELLLMSFDTIRDFGKRKDRQNEQFLMDTNNVKTRLYNKNNFTKKGNLLVMLFNPTCGHCEDQTDILEKNKALFKKSEVILMANKTMKTYLPDFIKNHHVHDYEMFTIGIDSLNFINSTFLYRALPQINIYNTDRKLIKIFAGQVPIDSLKEYID